jgi:hypothetical protein
MVFFGDTHDEKGVADRLVWDVTNEFQANEAAKKSILTGTSYPLNLTGCQSLLDLAALSSTRMLFECHVKHPKCEETPSP